jgi:radical SAM superfamily enzyme YgiQ (UPF0313 family)
MKVLLVSANTLNAPYSVYPIGLDYVKGALSGAHHVRIYDMNVDPEGLADFISEFKPDVVGVSVRNIDNLDVSDSRSFAENYRLIASEIKAATDAPLVLGGSGFTIFPQEIMRECGADFGIIGPGEHFAALLDALENKRPLRDIPGVVTRDSKSYKKSAQWGGPFKRDFDAEANNVPYYIEKGGILNLQTKRGCAYKCVYCTYSGIEGASLSLFPPDEVAATAMELQEAGAHYLFIVDSSFNCDWEHSLEVAQSFKKHGLVIPWGGLFTPLSPPRGYFRKLRDAGLKHVEFGTDSLSDPVLSFYAKPFRKADVFRAHEGALEAGLHIAHFFLPGGPGESRQTLEETLSGAEGLRMSALFFFCGMRIYPLTRLYQIAVEEGLIESSRDISRPVFYESRLLDGLNAETIVRNHSRGRLNWVIGSGGEKVSAIVHRMYARGLSGPLWEYMIR